MTRMLAIAAFLPFLLLVAPTRGEASDPAWKRMEVGMFVEVQTHLAPTGDLEADEVDVRASGEEDQVELIALLESIDLAEGTIGVLGVRMELDSAFTVKDEEKNLLPPESVTPGTWVELDGSLGTDGRVVVSRIKKLARPRSSVEIEGAITRLDTDGHVMEVAGLPVRLTWDTALRGAKGTLRSRGVELARAVDDDDSSPGTIRPFGDRLVMGGGLQLGVVPEKNFKLNPARKGDLVQSDWIAEIDLDGRISKSTSAYVKTGIERKVYLRDEEGDEQNDTRGGLRQAYLVWQPTRLPQLALQVGRQDFDEAREWLYDENLDAIRLHSQIGPVRTEASFSRRWNVDSPLLKEWRNWILYSEAGVARDWAVGGYVIHRRLPESADDRPVWVGLRSHGRITSGINHWLEISALRGDLGGSAMDAYCVDVGGSVRLHRETRFTVFGGAAYGSGGADPGSRFHQTGLHDNNDKFSGVSSLKYYGELLEPELSNLRIATAGFGFRPSGEISAEVIFHRYSQVHPDWDLGRTNLEVRPLGTSTDIGEEWDLVVGFEEITRVDAEYVFAVFLPGEAFLDGAEKAEMHRFQLKYKF